MSNVIEPGYVVPTPQPVKTLGLLNVVFASLLLLMSLWSIVSNLMMPSYMKLMQAQQQKMVADAQAKSDESTRKLLDNLKQREEVEKSAEKKAEIAAERASIQNRPKPFVPDTTTFMAKIVNDPILKKYQWVDYLTGIPLNLALLASGIALMRLKRWGRSVAIWAAGLKILRATGLTLVAVLVVSPLLTKAIGVYLDDTGRQVAAQQGNSPANAAKVQQGMRTVTRVVGAGMAGFYVITYLLAIIYPVVLLVLLNKPGARAALVAKPVDSGALSS